MRSFKCVVVVYLLLLTAFITLSADTYALKSATSRVIFLQAPDGSIYVYDAVVCNSSIVFCGKASIGGEGYLGILGYIEGWRVRWIRVYRNLGVFRQLMLLDDYIIVRSDYCILCFRLRDGSFLWGVKFYISPSDITPLGKNSILVLGTYLTLLSLDHGNILWERVIRGAGKSHAQLLLILPKSIKVFNGKIVIVGSILNALSSTSAWDSFILCVRLRDFNVLWAKALGGGGLDMLSDVNIMDNKIYVTGATTSFARQRSGVFFLRFNLGGSLECARIYSLHAEVGVKIYPYGDKLLIYGYSLGVNLLFHFDTNGNLIYAQSILPALDVKVGNVKLLGEDRILICGSYANLGMILIFKYASALSITFKGITVNIRGMRKAPSEVEWKPNITNVKVRITAESTAKTTLKPEDIKTIDVKVKVYDSLREAYLRKIYLLTIMIVLSAIAATIILWHKRRKRKKT